MTDEEWIYYNLPDGRTAVYRQGTDGYEAFKAGCAHKSAQAEQLLNALLTISDLTSAGDRPSYADWELRLIARAALAEYESVEREKSSNKTVSEK